jgi:hypothetical protein
MEGTRVALLADLLAWASNDRGSPIFWLIGMAGTGKSAIARTLGRILQDMGLLGSSFFCSRSKSPDLADVHKIVPTLSKGLADASPSFKSALFQMLRSNTDAAYYSLEEQFKTLLSQPFDVTALGSSPRRVIVLDAIDECAKEEDVSMLMRLIIKHGSALPIKFLITSRPEAHITTKLPPVTSTQESILWLHDIERDIVRQDIAKYLHAKLMELKDDRNDFQPSGCWPPPKQLDILADRADKPFIYAFTAYRYISDPEDDPSERLKELTLLPSGASMVSATTDVDEVYSLILRSSLRKRKGEKASDMLRVLGTLISVHVTPSVLILASLLEMPVSRVKHALAGLHSLVSVPQDDHSNEVATFHASFPDYLTDMERSGNQQWFVDSADFHRDITASCIRIMNHQLKFNVCGLTTSHKGNKEQPTTSVPGDLIYACQHWVNHWVVSPSLSVVVLGLSVLHFLRKKFLFWLEVLSCHDMVPETSGILRKALAFGTPVRNIPLLTHRIC